MHFHGGHTVLAALDDSGDATSLSLELSRKPLYEDPRVFDQHLIASVRIQGTGSVESDRTFSFPDLPELNEYYGRDAHFLWNAVRAEPNGLGIVISATTSELRLRALPKRELVARLFGAFGIACAPSQAGRIAARLINQMGGIQGCRVFKIPGVRKLIESYGPLVSFTRSCATQIIGQNDPVSGTPRFEPYENLYIEYREAGKLKPDDVLRFLLKRGVFRTGLKLLCPRCDLEFWISLDAIATDVQCEYCGQAFNISPQLRDRDWAYRRSGLFGRDDHQEGGIPVVIALQQLHTLSHSRLLFTTNMLLTPVTAEITDCETDLVFLSSDGYDHRVQIAIGECKTGGYEITADDVAKLTRVADALPADRLDVFILFAKTAPFTDAEILRCRQAQSSHRRRVILLSDRELEPYFVYERTALEFDIRSTAISLDDLANVTHDVYFEPKRKGSV